MSKRRLAKLESLGKRNGSEVDEGVGKKACKSVNPGRVAQR
jgi:hypothetical protein